MFFFIIYLHQATLDLKRKSDLLAATSQIQNLTSERSSLELSVHQLRVSVAAQQSAEPAPATLALSLKQNQ